MARTDRISCPAIMADAPAAHTYSIVARDTGSRELGVAVQSHWFSVGSTVSWAEAGVGAVATQAFADPGYGKMGLELMRAGQSAPEALARLLSSDRKREIRQVAMVDSQGRIAVHTGQATIPEAGHETGDGFSVQANMMLKATVWPAMAAAFKAARGDLAERMLAALEAAEREGGDVRGRQSAALVMVRSLPTGLAWLDRLFDVRVDDHPEPLRELRRLVGVQRAYGHKMAGDSAFARGELERGTLEYEQARSLLPDNLEFPFWHAFALLSLGRTEQAAETFREVFSKDRNWAILGARVARSGLMPCDNATAERVILQAAREADALGIGAPRP
jgi:uncharacterized Ntn-hydrolase superfamily protein